MKKFIVILLVMAVCINGVFAFNISDIDEESITGEYKGNENGGTATAKMVYTLPTGLIYAVFGFSAEEVGTDASGHLNPATPLTTIELKSNVNGSNVTASATFNIYYEIMATMISVSRASGQSSPSLILEFSEAFVGDNFGQEESFQYKKEIGSGNGKVTLSETDGTYVIISDSFLMGDESVVKGNIPVTVKTGDLSKMTPGVEYSAAVTLTVRYQ